MDFSIALGGIKLEHPLMNAAGTCKTFEQVKKLANSAAAAIMVGSITVKPRSGNSGNVYKLDPYRKIFSLNSLGLPNGGMPYYKEYLSKMADEVHACGKPLFVSVAGFSPEEYVELSLLVAKSGADLVELNLGCPNVWDGGVQKRPASYNPELAAQILYLVGRNIPMPSVPISVKISPFADFSVLEEMAGIMARYDIKAVSAVNAFPNALGFDDDGRPLITPGGGLAGLGGEALKPIGLGNVWQLRNLLPPRIALIGVGGVMSARDVLEYQKAGAVLVQSATAYLERGEQFFSDVLAELVE